MKKYICACGHIENTESDYLAHLDRHLSYFQNETKEEVSEVLQAFVSAFPKSKFKIKPTIRSHQFLIYLQKESLQIEQFVFSPSPNSSTFEQCIVNGIKELRKKLLLIHQIEKQVRELHLFDSFYCSRFEYDSLSSLDRYVFLFKVQADEKEQIHYFYPNATGNDRIANFIKEVREYALPKVEGTISFDDSDSYVTSILIDNVNINKLLNRKKSIRIQLLE